ncbi:hypothetical protein PM082_017161 [Marasmius tenuissimus]|nr:hypothetical protein PM082_017161 [Marasmius tenuissimus]
MSCHWQETGTHNLHLLFYFKGQPGTRLAIWTRVKPLDNEKQTTGKKGMVVEFMNSEQLIQMGAEKSLFLVDFFSMTTFLESIRNAGKGADCHAKTIDQSKTVRAIIVEISAKQDGTVSGKSSCASLTSGSMP